MLPGQYNSGPPPAAGMLGPTPTPAPGQFPPQLQGYSGANPAGLTFPGISQQNFPFLPHVRICLYIIYIQCVSSGSPQY
jgi:hypothetical protein